MSLKIKLYNVLINILYHILLRKNSKNTYHYGDENQNNILIRLSSTLKSHFVIDVIIAISFLISGIFLSSYISEWYDENYGKTLERLSGLLQSDKIQEFNDLRKQINVKIEFDEIDLSGKDLRCKYEIINLE